MMNTKKSGLINWKRALAFLSVPIVVGALLLAATRLVELFRYDESLFTESYSEIYSSPGSVAIDLEHALRTGDATLLRELQGVQSAPEPFQPNTHLVLSILTEVDGEYFHYMYFDQQEFKRLTKFIKKVDSRWVEVPEGLFYYVDSGQWLRFFAPLAALYWSLVVVVHLGVLVYRVTRRYRNRVYYSS
jgi:hypothetical protein